MKNLIIILLILLPLRGNCTEPGPGDPLRKTLLDEARRYIGYLEDSRFIVKHLDVTGRFAYFCGSAIDSGGNPVKTDEAIEVYDLILRKNAANTWKTVADFGSFAATRADIQCRFSQTDPLTDPLLQQAATQKPSSGSDAKTCRQEGNSIELTGKLTRETLPGPPGYESIANGDQPETYWFLKTEKPISCVAHADTTWEHWNTRFQLILKPEDYKTYARLPGKPIKIKGRIVLAVSAHHKTAILLEKQTLTPLE